MTTAADPGGVVRRAAANSITGDRLRRLPVNTVAGRLVLTSTHLRWQRHWLEWGRGPRESWSVHLAWISACRAGGRVGPIARLSPAAIAGEHLAVVSGDGSVQRFVVARARAWVEAIEAAANHVGTGPGGDVEAAAPVDG